MQLGARVTWQDALPIVELLEPRSERQIVVSCRPRRVRRGVEVSWVVVPEVAWTTMEEPLSREPAIRFAYPAGSVENRPSRRQLAQKQAASRYRDLAMFSQVVCWTDWQRFAGERVARRDGDRVVLEVIP